MKRIGFLGAGKMGGGMISCLLRAGHRVTVYNRTPKKLAGLLSQGAISAQTPAEAAAGADVVFAMVMDDAASREVWLGPTGALDASLEPDAVLVECSTLSYKWVAEFHQISARRGFASLDCPVAGRPSAASAGQLDVFVGGHVRALERVRPLLSNFAKSVTHFGPAGTGIAFKLIYNMVGAIQLASLAEAMAACNAVGVDLPGAARALAEGATGSLHVRHHGALMASGEHIVPPPFTARGRLKDLSYAIDLLNEFDVRPEVAVSAAGLYQLMVEVGSAELSDTELFDTLRDRNDLRRRA